MDGIVWYYLCVGPFCWGKGDNIITAIREAAKNAPGEYLGGTRWTQMPRIVYRWDTAKATDVYIDGDGSLCWKQVSASEKFPDPAARPEVIERFKPAQKAKK